VKLIIIAALSRNRVIGKDGKIPWHISEDLKRFKRITTGHTVLMGRKSFESMGKPLANRRNIVLTSKEIRGVETYKKLEEALKGLKNRNKLTFDKKGLTTELKQQFPEISNVTVELPLFGQVPSIRLSIAKPSLVLKGAEGTIGAAERLIVDAKGTLIGSQQNFPSVKDLPLITDETGFVANIGQPILSLSDVSFILNVLAQAEKAKVPIASLTLPKLAQELDLRTSDRNYFVKLYLGGDALLQAGQFLAARAQFDKQNSQPSQYLDVRVPGKIYFK